MTQTAIITGASSGIGKAVALKLAQNGYNVALCARREEKLNEVKAEILKENKDAGVLVGVVDVTDADVVNSFVSQVVDTFGKVDVLINNAGLMPLSFIRNLHVAEWKRMVDVNINGVLNFVAACLPLMREADHGFIMNISSDADRKYFPGSAVYSGTKAFVSMFSEGLKTELAQEGKHIRVASMSSGATASELFAGVTDTDVFEALGAPSFDVLTAEEYADIVFYVLSAPPNVNIGNVLFRPTFQPN